MALQYTNRKGDTYLLQAGKTRTGKPRYWFGRKLTGEPVEGIPEGYEISERPEDGLVSLRKIKPTTITQAERELVEEGIRRYVGLEYFTVSVEAESLVVYLPNFEKQSDPMWRILGGSLSRSFSPWSEARESLRRNAVYSKMMRFDLADRNTRLFTVSRWCFRGSIDDWLPLMGRPAPLAKVVQSYVRHLGKDTFYELM